MTQTVNVPGVGTLNFPDSMSHEDMAAAIKKAYPEIHARKGPANRGILTPEEYAKKYAEVQAGNVEGMSTPAKLAAGAGKAVVDTGRGIGQMLGMVSPEDVAESRRTDAALMATKAGKVGNALGYIGESVPVALAAPELAGTAAAAKIGIGGATGAAQGFAAPYASQGEHVMNTLAGFGAGAVIPGTGALASKAIRGLATPEARLLAEGGAKLTPGQMLGGAAKWTEDKLTSVPIVGGAIRKAQQRALDTFNTATINKALEPIERQLGSRVAAGYDAVARGRGVIERYYDRVLGQMSGKLDPKLSNEVAATINSHVNTLGADQAKKLIGTIDEQVIQKLGKGQQIGGDEIKRVVSQLGQEARAHLKSMAPDDQKLGRAFLDVQESVKGMLKRQNPTNLVRQLEKADAAHARMLRVENAASKVGAEEGKFTPSQLRNAVAAEDPSYKKRAVSQGKALLQEWADAAKSAIPSKVPDSGTAGREGAANLLANMALLPATATAGGAAHVMYSAPAQAIMQRAFMPRQNGVTNYLANLAANRLGAPRNALYGQALLPQAPPPPVPQQ